MKKAANCLMMMFLFGISFAFAQAPPSKVTPAGEKLAFILGEWQGKGWMITRTGKENSQVTEKAECKLGCALVVVSGQGVKVDTGTGERKIVHDAFGVISYDAGTNKYMIRAYRGNDIAESEIQFLEEKIIRWVLPIPAAGTMRYTVDFNQPGKWKETGEFSRDGVTWMKTMEMELERGGN